MFKEFEWSFSFVFHALRGLGKLDEFHRLYYTSQYNGTSRILHLILLHQWKPFSSQLPKSNRLVGHLCLVNFQVVKWLCDMYLTYDN